MAQDNEVKKPAQMPTPENTAGNESGETVLIPGTGTSAPAQNPSGEINGTASSENRSAQFKYGEGGPAQSVPDAAQNQYQ